MEPLSRLERGAVARWIARAAVVASLAVALGGCSKEAPPEGSEPGAPHRIVAVAPAVVELLFALDLGPRVVGVGDYASWPPEVESRTRIGGLFDARLETIAELAPDLAVLMPSEGDLGADLERLGVDTLTVRLESLDDVAAAARALGERAGVAERAAALVAELEAELAPRPVSGVTGSASGGGSGSAPSPGVGAPVVLLSLAREPGRLAEILTAGPGTFLDELVARLGAVNAFGDAQVRYPQIGAESVLERRPGVVIELQPNEPEAETEAALLADWQGLQGLALAEDCVGVVAGSHVLLPGPRLPRLYRELREILERCVTEGGQAAR